MPEEPAKPTLNDIDESPLRSETQPRIDKSVLIDSDFFKSEAFNRLLKSAEERFNLKDRNRLLEKKTDALEKTLDANDELNKLIKPYSKNSFWFMCSYCSFVGVLLLLQGFKICNFSLSDPVLQLIVGSTAVTVIGLVGMVLTGIFVGARKK